MKMRETPRVHQDPPDAGVSNAAVVTHEPAATALGTGNANHCWIISSDRDNDLQLQLLASRNNERIITYIINKGTFPCADIELY